MPGHMTVTLVNVPDVPIVSTGTYQLASGEATFSVEDLADAVQAAQDATVPVPRIKLGHTDPRFEEAIASGDLDGEPAFGTVQNLRLSPDGQTVLGDYCDVPDWLADTLPSSFPGRSIEGGFGYTAPSGRTYRLVIARVALLGITWPGVTSLADLREVLEQNGQAQDTGQVEAASDTFVVARVARPGDGSPPRTATSVQAGIDFGNIRMQFCDDLDSGEVPKLSADQPQADEVGPQTWWWPRSVRVEDDGTTCLIVDDDEGHLIRIPFTVEQADLVYGAPELVVETYVPVTSDPDESRELVTASGASWPVVVRAARRPSNQQEAHTVRLNGVEVDAAALRQRLGLADDADDAAITAALGIPEETPAPAPAAQTPEGMVLVDEETFNQVRENAEQGAAVAARTAREDRDRTIQAAIQDGKIPPGRRDHYVTLWDRDQEGTRTLLTAAVADGGLAPGLIPTNRRETGHGGDGDTSQTDEATHAAFMASHFPNETQRLSRGSVRVRQEA